MLHKIPVADGVEIVFSQMEAGYSEVLDTLDDAIWIDVVTYNLSSNDDALMQTLRDLQGVDIRVVTNVPNRYPQYYGDKPKSKFRTTLANYRAFLEPKAFKGDLTSFFNISNHSKIVMTDKLAYIGSSNFSSESHDKYECGVLFKSPEVIERIRAEIVDQLVEDSAPRDLSAIAEAKLFVMNIRQQLKELLLSLKEGFYAPLDDLGEGPESFRWQDAEVSEELLDRFGTVLDEVESGLDSYEGHAHLAVLNEHIDIAALQEIRESIEDSDNALRQLAEWNLSDEVVRHFQKYAFEAYDEKVDAFMERANDDALEEHKELIQEARQSLFALGKLIVKVFDSSKAALAALQQNEKTKWGIDNA